MDKIRDFLISLRWLFGVGIGLSFIVTVVGLVVFLDNNNLFVCIMGFGVLVFCIAMTIAIDAMEDRKKEEKVKA